MANLLDMYDFTEATELPSPQLIFYKDIVLQNIGWVVHQAKGAANLWIHVKTHKSADLIRLLQSKGINQFKCATIAEAEMAAMNGAKSILLAYTLVGPNIDRYIELVDSYSETRFFAMVDSDYGIASLEDAARRSNLDRVHVFVDLDVGQQRTGVDPSKAIDFVKRMALSDVLVFSGFHCYDGHVVDPDMRIRRDKVSAVHEIVDGLLDAVETLKVVDDPIVIYGGSPTFTLHTERVNRYFSPGTIILHDHGYARKYDDIKCTPGALIMGRVISHPAPDLFTIDIGSKAIASDPGVQMRGSIVGIGDKAKSVLQNEEHWVWKMNGYNLDKPAIGDVLFVIPEHICPSVALYREAVVVSDGRIESTWPIIARDRRITI